MKITDFEFGKKYRLSTWQENHYVKLIIANAGLPMRELLNQDRKIHNLSFEQAISDDWQEYVEKIQMGKPDIGKDVLIEVRGSMHERVANWDGYEWCVYGASKDGDFDCNEIDDSKVISWRDTPAEQKKDDRIDKIRNLCNHLQRPRKIQLNEEKFCEDFTENRIANELLEIINSK